MSDPAEITQQATQAVTDGGPATHAAWAILGGIVLKVIEAFARLRGSPKERAEAEAAEAEASVLVAETALRVAKANEERAERADEETASHRIARATCEEQLREHREQSARERAEDRARIAALESGLAEHATCGLRIAALEDDVALSKRMLSDYMSNTPRHGITGADVQAAALQETHGKR